MISRSLSLLALLFVSAVATAQTVEPPRFRIDSIRVEGLRWSSERVVIAQSRLQPGREYLESELRAGAARAARLPFVVRIDLRLEKGDERGAYELVLEVIETKPFFIGGLAQLGPDELAWESLTGGARVFAGRSGLVFGAVTAGDDRGGQLGYTQYDLFGTGASVTAVIARRRVNAPRGSLAEVKETDRIGAQLIAAIPIRGNHALRASFIREPLVIRSFGVDDAPFIVEHVSTAEAAWIYDSTNDRLFATDGTVALGSASLRRGPYVTADNRRTPRLTHYTRPSFGITGRHHRELTPQHSMWGAGSSRYSLRGAQVFNQFGGIEVDTSTFFDWSAQTGYAFTAWADDRAIRYGDLRFEATLNAVGQRGRIPRDPMFGGDFTAVYQFTTAGVAVLFRNQYAVLRVYFDVLIGGDL